MSLIASAPAQFPARILTCLLSSLVNNVYAADPDTVVVTATRTEQSLDNTLAAVTVLTRDDIDRLQARSIDELLRGMAGVSHDNAGGFGKATSIFLRGTESDHTVVLIDGVRFGSPTLGIAAFEHLPIDQIERIEIVRGPRSALYGPDAIGGVIQFITRGRRDGLRVSAQTGYGSDDTRRLSAGLDAQSRRLWISAHFADFASDGINACAGLPFPPGGRVLHRRAGSRWLRQPVRFAAHGLARVGRHRTRSALPARRGRHRIRRLLHQQRAFP